MHRAPRLAERSMCRVPCSNYGSVRLGLSVGAHRCQRRGEERSVAGSQAEEPPNQRTRRNNVVVAVAGRPPHRSIRSLRQRVLIQVGYYSGGRVKEDVDGFRYSLDARGILLLSSSSLLLSSSASFPPFRMAPATGTADGFSGCGPCSGIYETLPLSGDERCPGAAVPPPAAGHSVRRTDRFRPDT